MGLGSELCCAGFGPGLRCRLLAQAPHGARRELLESRILSSMQGRLRSFSSMSEAPCIVFEGRWPSIGLQKYLSRGPSFPPTRTLCMISKPIINFPFVDFISATVPGVKPKTWNSSILSQWPLIAAGAPLSASSKFFLALMTFCKAKACSERSAHRREGKRGHVALMRKGWTKWHP